MSNIFIWVKKRLVWVVLDIEEIRDKDNETGLKEGGGIEMSIYSAPFACRSFALCLLTLFISLILIL